MDEKVEIRLPTSTWLGAISVLVVQGIAIFGAVLFWTNRLVIVETEFGAMKEQVRVELYDVRVDIKTLLRESRAERDK